MKFGDAVKAFKEKKWKPYILFYGEEGYFRRVGLEAALHELHVGTPELNVSVFEERADAGDVARAMETLPFMSEVRAVVLKNTDLLTSAAAAELTEPITKAHMPRGNVLLITLNGKPDKRKQLYKKIAAEGMLVECTPPSDNELARYAVQAAKTRGLILSLQNAQYLCELCGGEPGALETELEKLGAVCLGNISREEIEKYTAKSRQFNVFRIHDLLCAQKLGEANQAINRMLLDDSNPVGFISLIAGNFRQMLVARACRDARFSEARTMRCIADETGAKEWAAKRALQRCKKYTAEALRKGLKKLARMDYMAKQGETVLKTDLFALLADIYTASGTGSGKPP
jgi:DNA polymerase III delta subunit